MRVPRQRRARRQRRAARADRGDLVVERAGAEQIHLRPVHQRGHAHHAGPVGHDHHAAVAVEVKVHAVVEVVWALEVDDEVPRPVGRERQLDAQRLPHLRRRSVRADHQARGLARGRALAFDQLDADHAPAVLDQLRQLRPIADRNPAGGARLLGERALDLRVRQHEIGVTRRIAERRLHQQAANRVADLHLRHRRRARGAHAFERAPRGDVAGDRGQQAVAAVDVARPRAPLDQQHPKPAARERQRLRRAADAGADHDRRHVPACSCGLLCAGSAFRQGRTSDRVASSSANSAPSDTCWNAMYSVSTISGAHFCLY